MLDKFAIDDFSQQMISCLQDSKLNFSLTGRKDRLRLAKIDDSFVDLIATINGGRVTFDVGEMSARKGDGWRFV